MFSINQNEPSGVCILAPMMSEATPIIEKLELEVCDQVHSRYGMSCFRSTSKSPLPDIALITSGTNPRLGVCNVGSEAAALTAHLALDLNPSVIITAGTCGGLQQEGATIGKPYIAGPFRGFIDRTITIPKYDKAVQGPFEASSSVDIAEKTGIAQGCPVTSSSFDHTDKELRNSEVLAAGLPRNFEMEDASVARVLDMMLGKKPSLYSIRVVVNLLDGGPKQAEQFLANLELATKNVADATYQVCQVLQDGSVESLKV